MTRSIACSLLLLVTPAWSQTAAPKPAAQPQASPFERADANHDGKVTRAEFVAARSARFDQIDRNHDGVINRADFPGIADHQKALARLDAQIAAADANHDGAVSRKELSGAATPFFDRVDTNHDGAVNQAEAAAFRQAVAAHRKPRP